MKKHYEKIDKLFMKEDEEVSPLEQAARICMERSFFYYPIQMTLALEGCAIDIRNHPDWSMYIKKDIK